MATTIVPRVATIHFISNEPDYHVRVTGIKEDGTFNRVLKAITDLATLANAIAFILEVWAPIGSDGVVQSSGEVGDLHALAAMLTARYPAGYIPARPTT